MTGYFLGADIGGTKTQVLIADESGRAVGMAVAGPGNHESVGYDGTQRSLQTAYGQALAEAGLRPEQIRAAGFGVAGYDWPSELRPTVAIIESLGFKAPSAVVNDTILGLLAGSPEGWGVAVVSGTGCNCRGWGKDRRRQGRVTGGGVQMGEAAGASELVFKAVQAVAFEWTRRGPRTLLSDLFIRSTRASSLEDLMEGLMSDRYELNAAAAPLIFRAAEAGDAVAVGLVEWAGLELGEMVNAVVRQLEFETLDFDLVMMGSMFSGGLRLIEPMQRKVHSLAPGARLVRLAAPPVIGAVLLAVERADQQASTSFRQNLARTVSLLTTRI